MSAAAGGRTDPAVRRTEPTGRRTEPAARRTPRTETPAARPGERTGWRAVVHALYLGLSTGLLALVCGLALVLIVIPKATGSTPLTVLTRSMEPTLPPGTLIVVRPVAPRDIRVGDVVTYQIAPGRPEVISHRVVSISSSTIEGRTFVLRGDANPAADPNPVTVPQIRGRVWYSIPALGWVNQLVNGARSWLIPTTAAALIAYGAVMIATGLVSTARRRARPKGAHAAWAGAVAPPQYRRGAADGGHGYRRRAPGTGTSRSGVRTSDARTAGRRRPPGRRRAGGRHATVESGQDRTILG